MHKCTEVDSEGSEKEEEHSQVKQKGSETMTSTSKGITSRHACLVFSYVIYVNTYGPINVDLYHVSKIKPPYINYNNALGTKICLL